MNGHAKKLSHFGIRASLLSEIRKVNLKTVAIIGVDTHSQRAWLNLLKES